MKQQILDLTNNNQQIEITENSELLGVFVGRDIQKLVTNLDVIHKTPELQSLTLIKAVLYDESRFDMTGNLIIETGARNTDAYLRIDVLIMNDKASARAVPSLEITEDSVKGGHGATVGQVNAEQLFYLRSRGLTKSESEEVLVKGFVQELVDKVKDPKDKEQVLRTLNF